MERRVVDIFMALNETQLASFRIKYLESVVSHILIGESPTTFSGNPKPETFRAWHQSLRYEDQKKISIVTIPLEGIVGAWGREQHSRDYLQEYARQNFSGWKYIFSDLDEIPSRSQIMELIKSKGTFHFLTPTYYRRCNWAQRGQEAFWSHGVMGEVDSMQLINGGRFQEFPQIGGVAGAHLSFLGFDADQLSSKLNSFAHIELSKLSEYAYEILHFCDYYRIDHLGRFQNSGNGVFGINFPADEAMHTLLSEFIPNCIDVSSNIPTKISRLWASAQLELFISLYVLNKKIPLYKPSLGKDQRFSQFMSQPTFNILCIFFVIRYSLRRIAMGLFLRMKQK